MQTKNTNPDAARDAGQTEALIYVQVPHQMPVRAYSFDSQADFKKWLRKEVSNEFDYSVYTREQWEEKCKDADEEPGSDWWQKWAQPGFDLFDSGAQNITDIWWSGSNHDLEDTAKCAYTEYDAMLKNIDDFHAHFVLDQESAIAVASGTKTLCQHQGIKIRIAVEEEAELLGWIETPADVEEEEEDESQSLICGNQIQIDRSGQGHNWSDIDAQDLPPKIREEIEGEIIDGGKDETDCFVGSNGQHYRW